MTNKVSEQVQSTDAVGTEQLLLADGTAISKKMDVDDLLKTHAPLVHGHSKADVGLPNVDNTADAVKVVSGPTQTALNGKSDTGHGHAKGDVGLPNVDNTADAVKVVSGPTQTTLNGKSDIGHSHTPAEVGLPNVEDTADLDKVVSTATQAELDLRLTWLPKWVPGTSIKNTLSRDGAWVMIANADTDEKPAPTPTGSPSSAYSVEPVFTLNSDVSSVRSGTTYTFTKSGWLKNMRVRVPELGDDINYRFIISDITDPGNPIETIIESDVLIEGGWAYVSCGSYLVSIGSVIKIQIEASKFSAVTNVGGAWNTEVEEPTNPPAIGGWNRTPDGTTIKVSATDLAPLNRLADLLTIGVDSIIKFTENGDTTKYVKYRVTSAPVDNTSYVTYSVLKIAVGPGGLPTDTVDSDMVADIPTLQSVGYYEEALYWASNSVDWATVSSFLEFDGVDQGALTQSAFGIDLKFQPAKISSDWDLVLYSIMEDAASDLENISSLSSSSLNKYDRFPAGEILAYGDLCRLASDGKMWKADNAAQATIEGVLSVYLGPVAAVADTIYAFLTEGLYDDAGTIGETLYLGLAGAYTATRPVTVDTRRVIGMRPNASQIHFKPSLDNN